MNSDTIPELTLESLAEIPVVIGDEMYWFKNTCIVCLDSQGHESGVRLAVDSGESNKWCRITWVGGVTDQMRKSHADLVQATEYGAYAIAFLVIRESLDLVAVEQAQRGTRVDFYLAPEALSEPRDATLIFNHTARLEVSGILRESDSNTVDGRTKAKLDRLEPDGLPTFVAIVEFGHPCSKITEA
jgi:hypothetical protein